MAGCGAGERPGRPCSRSSPRPHTATLDAVHLADGPFPPADRVDTYSGSADMVTAPYQVSFDPGGRSPGRQSVAGMSTRLGQQRPDRCQAASGAARRHVHRLAARRGRERDSSSALTFSSLGPISTRRISYLSNQRPAERGPTGRSGRGRRAIDDGAGHPLGAHESVSSPGLDAQTPARCLIDDRTCAHSRSRHLPAGCRCRSRSASTRRTPCTTPRPDTRASTPRRPQPSRRLSPPGTTLGGTSITVRGQGFIGGRWQIMIDGVAVGAVGDHGRNDPGHHRRPRPGQRHGTVSNGDIVTDGYGIHVHPTADPEAGRSADRTRDERDRSTWPATSSGPRPVLLDPGRFAARTSRSPRLEPVAGATLRAAASAEFRRRPSTCSPGQARSPSARPIRCREIRSSSTRSRSIRAMKLLSKLTLLSLGVSAIPLAIAGYRRCASARGRCAARSRTTSSPLPAGRRSCQRRPAAPVVDPARRRAHLRSDGLRAGRPHARGATEVPAAGLPPERRFLRDRAVRRAWLRCRLPRTWRTRRLRHDTAITSRCAPSTSNRWG